MVLRGMKVLVCGGRKFNDYHLLDRALTRLHKEKGPIKLIVNGDALGADKASTVWAERNNISVAIFPAEWKRYGKSAGPRRNASMLRQTSPDCVVCFQGGHGTADMVMKARDANIPVWEVKNG